MEEAGDTRFSAAFAQAEPGPEQLRGLQAGVGVASLLPLTPAR